MKVLPWVSEVHIPVVDTPVTLVSEDKFPAGISVPVGKLVADTPVLVDILVAEYKGKPVADMMAVGKKVAGKMAEDKMAEGKPLEDKLAAGKLAEDKPVVDKPAAGRQAVVVVVVEQLVEF